MLLRLQSLAQALRSIGRQLTQPCAAPALVRHLIGHHKIQGARKTRVVLHVYKELQINLDMPCSVPHLARHIHGALPGHASGTVAHRAPSPFHGLYGTDHETLETVLPRGSSESWHVYVLQI